MHMAEGLFGEALAASPGLRQRIKVVTKCGIRLTNTEPQEVQRAKVKHYDTSAAHIRLSVENSLRLLGMEALDLLLIHRPDPLLDADEVASVFYDLHRAGKVRHFGVSNHTPRQCELLARRLHDTGLRLATHQTEISVRHLAAFDDGVLDQAQQWRIRPMAWSPLAGGQLQSHAKLWSVLTDWGHALNASGEQVALAWLLRHPAGIVPVIGTGNIERVAALARAVDIALDREAWFAILEASRGHAVA
jgi:predicted oxidoreductase